MIDIKDVKVLLMEEEYPFFSDATLTSMCNLYDSINELCYVACTMKAKVDSITVGPITIPSNSEMWNNLANVFYKKYIKESKRVISYSGYTVGRSDEY